MSYTFKNLQSEVDRLNKQYKKSDKTAVKLKVDCAYGGYKVVVKQNMPYGSGVASVTNGFQTAKETAFDLFQRERDLKNELKRVTKYTVRDAQAKKNNRGLF